MRESGKLDDKQKHKADGLTLQPESSEEHQRLRPFRASGNNQRALTAEHHFNQAVALHAEQRHADAIAAYMQALSFEPTMAEAHYNMGIIYSGQRSWPQAILHFKKALDQKRNYADAAFNLAAALKESGNHRRAVAIFQLTLDLDPCLADAHYQQGLCLLLLGDPLPAVQSFRNAVELAPLNARYWFHKAEAHMLADQIEAALECYGKVVELRPEWDSAHYNLAVCLHRAERLEDAISHARQVVQINPDHVKVFPLLFRLAQHACDWPLADAASQRLDEITAMELDRGLPTTEPPLTSLRRKADVQANLEVARSWSRHLTARILTEERLPSPVNGRRPSDRLRIGYLSSDFKDHAVAYQIRGLLEEHDRRRFQVYGYACNPDDGTPYRRRLADACDVFRDVHAHPNAAIARQIQEDGIHILVDMAGHSKDNRLGIAAMRPAPVQVGYLGFLGSTGADFIDYALTDTIVVPTDHAAFYSEKMAYLPNCYQANDDRMPISGQTQHRKMWHLPEKAFVYCSFNQPYKIDARLFGCWMNILGRVENSVLWLVERSGLARENLRRAASRAAVDPERLVFTGFVPLDQNLARLKLADLVLDTLVYNGGATTSNALWAEVPVITTLGNHWVSRMSASALNAVGLPELIAADLAAYEQTAIELALDPDRMENLRGRLQRQRQTSPLFSTTRFVRHVERAYERMWLRHGKGLPADTFHVGP